MGPWEAELSAAVAPVCQSVGPEALTEPKVCRLPAGGKLCGRPPRVKSVLAWDRRAGCGFVSGLFARPMAAGLDGLSASRGSHLDFALDAHPLAAGLPRLSVRLTVHHLLRPAFRSGTCRSCAIRQPAAAARDKPLLA